MAKLKFKDDVSELFSGVIAGNFYKREIRNLAQKIEIKNHDSLLEKINEISPYEINRDLYSLDYMTLRGEGGLIIDKSGIVNPVVSDAVANLRYSWKNYSEEEMFEEIVAHEYGHIIYDEYLFEKVKSFERKRFFGQERLRQSEAFAFWFGDFISGVKVSKKQIDRYKCSNGESLYSAYKRLTELGQKNKDKCFNPQILSRIFHETR